MAYVTPVLTRTHPCESCGRSPATERVRFDDAIFHVCAGCAPDHVEMIVCPTDG